MAGRTVFVSEWVPSGTTGVRPGTRTEYWVPLLGTRGPVGGNIPYTADPLGRVTRVRQADGAVVETTYDGLRRTVTVRDLNRVPGSGADVSPWPTETTTTFTNDAFGRLVHVDAPEGGEDASYTYDVLDNLVRVEMGTQVREFQFDALGRLRLASNPENGTVTYGSYGPTGLLKQQTDAAGVETFWIHDAAGRVIEESSGTGVTIRGFLYDTPQGPPPAGGGVNRSAGRLVRVGKLGPNSALEVERVLIYAGLNGRLSEEQTRFDEAGTLGVFSTGYSYNAFGLPFEVRYPERVPLTGGALVVRSEYLHGHLRHVGDAIAPERFVEDVLYNMAGAPRQVEMGNDTWTKTDYDLRNRPSRILALTQADTVAGNHLGPPSGSAPRLADGPGVWDEWLRSRPLSPAVEEGTSRPRLPVDLLALAQGFEVDPDAGGGGGPAHPPVFAWDSGLYSYDGAGNIIAIGADDFTYDAHGRLAGAHMANLPGPGADETDLTWTYDGYGNMLEHRKTVGSSTHRHTFGMDDDIADPGVGTSNHIRTLDVDYQGDLDPESWSLAYDAVGNLTSDGQRQLIWDVLGRLREVRRTEDGATLGVYGYDDRDYRARKVEDGFETFYIRDVEGRVLSEFRRPEGSIQPPAWDQDYVYALGGAVATVKNDVPQAPKSLRATWGLKPLMEVVLRWAKDPEPDILGYRVYRRSYPGGTASFELRLAVNGLSVTQGAATDPVVFVDPDNPLAGYEYYVTAVDQAGHESAHSRHLAVVPEGGVSSTYTTWLTPAITAGDGALELHWYVAGDAAMVVNGYNVYRRSPAVPGEDVFQPRLPAGQLLEQPGYTDVGLVNGRLYEYKVTAVNTAGSEPEPTDPYVLAEAGTPQDSVPPGPPPSVRVTKGTGSGELLVSWTPSNAHDLVGYRLYDVTGATPVPVGNDLPVVPRTIKLTGLGNGATRSYALTAYDDASPTNPNESVLSPSATATTWGGGALAYLDVDLEWRKIFEWGTPRNGGLQKGLAFHWQSDEPPLYQDYYEYGWPVLFRAAELYMIPDPSLCWEGTCYKPYETPPNPGTFLGYNVYRSSCPDPVTQEIPGELILLTPAPVLDDYLGWGDAVFKDFEPKELCHLYYITAVGRLADEDQTLVESGPVKETRNGSPQNGVTYTWAYAPNEVMGQYAYGAKLVVRPGSVSPTADLPIAISPFGGWELGSALPGEPVILRWRKSPHPEVVAYRLWVKDASRVECPQGMTSSECAFFKNQWYVMADVSRETTTYYDYDAPKGWLPECTDSTCALWYWNTCHVWPGSNLNLYGGACGAGTREVAQYYVEGLVEGYPDAENDNLPYDFGPLTYMWEDGVRAIGIEQGACPVYSHNVCCNPSGCQSDLWLPEGIPGAGEGSALRMAESRESEPPATGERSAARPAVLGGLTIMTQWNVDFPREPALEALEAGISPRQMAAPAPDRLIGQLSPATTTQWLHVDHLGSTRVVTDESGAVVSKHKYLPFGEEYRSFGAPATNSHKFTGHERDEETGLDYMFARYYGNQLSRFLSVDPAAESVIPSLPQTWSRYTYALNSPVGTNDPDGRCPLCIAAAVGGAIAGGVELYRQYEAGDGFDGQKLAAATAGGAVGGVTAVLTGGGTVAMGAVAGGTGSLVGGAVTREFDGDPDTEATGPEAAVDAFAGALGGAAEEAGRAGTRALLGGTSKEGAAAGQAAAAAGGKELSTALQKGAQEVVGRTAGTATELAARPSDKQGTKPDANKKKDTDPAFRPGAHRR